MSSCHFLHSWSCWLLFCLAISALLCISLCLCLSFCLTTSPSLWTAVFLSPIISPPPHFHSVYQWHSAYALILLSLLFADTSEQLEARKAPEKAEPQHIPGLNFKAGSRQRLSSPAPIAQSAPRPAPPPQPSQVGPRTSMPPPPSPVGAAYMSFGSPPPPGAGMPAPRQLGRVSSVFVVVFICLFVYLMFECVYDFSGVFCFTETTPLATQSPSPPTKQRKPHKKWWL